ncbi:MAG: hypothetical protein M3416_06840 [Acidobacteriota bacterium]|nr:hypothetical protein [Acidobacteriota bacterium]
MLKQILCALIVSVLLAASAQAQRRRPVPFPPATQTPQPRPLGSPEAELLKRAEIRHEEESHKEMVERADETVRLGGDLRDAFVKYKGFNREDLKRLERMEKLARKIRSGAGGSDDDEQLKDPPAQLDQAVARLAEVSEKLGESVRKTSRLVVSAAVIEGSNELIELIRHIRTFVKP